MKNIKKYSKVLSIILSIIAFICAMLTIYNILYNKGFALPMVLAICFWVIAGGVTYLPLHR